MREAKAASVPEELLARAETKLKRMEVLYRLDAERRRHRMYYLLYQKWPCLRRCLLDGGFVQRESLSRRSADADVS